MLSLPASPSEVQRPIVTTSTVPFYGDHIDAVRVGGEVWVGLRRCCESLGVSMQGQLLKLRKSSWATINEMLTVADDGKRRQQTMIHLDSLPMWLATVHAGKVAAELRPLLVRYQREAAKVLAKHFLGDAPTDRGPPSPRLADIQRRIGEIYEALSVCRNELGDLIGVGEGEAVVVEAKAAERMRLFDYCKGRGIASSLEQRLVWATKLRARSAARGEVLATVEKGTYQTYPVDLMDAFFAEATTRGG